MDRTILDKLHRKPFSISQAIPSRGADCLDRTLDMTDYTEDPDIFFTDNWLPVELKDVPGKYVWIGFPYGRGKTVCRFKPIMMDVARKIHGAEIFDYTDTTNMLFLFIPED